MATNSQKVAQIQEAFNQETAAGWISNLWDNYNNQRSGKLQEWAELQRYIFATDTQTTSNSSLPWKNSTTIPKICQIRDNLHSNYMASLFPNDNWLTWMAYDEKSASKQKAKIIRGYMENKSREGGLRSVISKLIYDYIDYGNAFSTTSFERRFNMVDGENVPDFIGPTAVRIHPLDIVFNPLAASFDKTFKIIRSVKTIGELLKLAQDNPDQSFWADVLNKRMERVALLSGYKKEDFDKAVQIAADGFGDYYQYLQSDYVEILEFYGDYQDADGTLHVGRRITITDRAHVAQDIKIPTYSGRPGIYHVGWRERSDNLWAMGPLDNLVGLQYRLDHLENAKADAFDLAIQPPLKIIGEVEAFVWGPSAEIHLDENGDVQEVAKNLNSVITAASEMEAIEARMELYAGAPREAMGIRSPGEKTAFEVQVLENAASRIFQQKISQFEVEMLEKLLNGMFEEAHRNMDMPDVVRTFDSDLNAVEFTKITKSDITAKGILRPIGARHFAQQANQLQNVIGIFNSPIGQLIAPHTSAKELTRFVEDVTDLRGYAIFRDNVGIIEQKETATMMNQASEDLQVESSVDVSGVE
jgi:hypothetical protein